MKTFENYTFDDSLLIEQSTDDGSIVKVETHNKALDEWFDVTQSAVKMANVQVLALSFFSQYKIDGQTSSSRTPLREMFDEMFDGGLATLPSIKRG